MYRLKGVVAVDSRAAVRRYVINLVGTSIHVAAAREPAPEDATTSHLVAIGMHLESDEVRARLASALVPGSASDGGLRRLQRY